MFYSESKVLSPGLTRASAALFIFFWASGFISAKFGFPYSEPFTFLALRFGLAILIMTPLCILWGAIWPKTSKEIFHVLIAGWLVQTVYLVGVWYSIWLGVATGVVALIVGLQPLITGIFSASFLGERVNSYQWLGLLFGFFGLTLVVTNNINFFAEQIWSVSLCLFALLGITFGTFYQRRFCSEVDIRTAVVIQNFGSLFLILPLALVFEEMAVEWTNEFVFALFWSAVGLSVIAIALFYILVRNGAAAKVTSMIYLSPPTTAFMGWLVFDESLSGTVLIGFVFVALGVALVTRS
ncbi:MAG: EamA family transporter [Rhodospirillaceae bacterium]|nr:EamA family transporter [Rhodospirillaceae bacterium]|tara:strand:+ start:3414 stop:4301 length:888 start_codon:yes stop_codon:yes gene_type:complete